MNELAKKKCGPCRNGVPALEASKIAELVRAIPAWKVVDDHHLRHTVKTKDFAQGLALVNRIGAIAESEGHHPDLTLVWGRVDITIYTHKVDGLTENDFILAAKIDGILKP